MSRLEQLQALQNKEPDDAFVNFAIAMELSKAGRFQESLNQFDRVISLDPKYVAAHFQKARTLVTMGDEQAARAELHAGIAAAQACGDLHASGEMQEMLDGLG
jgi:predicted Zn-dependent protease